MGGKGSGRRDLYTAEVHSKIIKALEAGAFKVHAAWYSGISDKTLELWLRKGIRGEAPYAKLYEDVQEAISKDAVRNQGAISAAAIGEHKGDWKAAAWNLEKKHPRLYGSMAEYILKLKIEEEHARRRARRLEREQAEREERPYSPFKPPTERERHAEHRGNVRRRLDA